MLNLITWIKQFFRFLHCKVTLFSPFPYCTPWKEVTVHSAHFWLLISLSPLEYLYNLFGILPHGILFSSSPFLFCCSNHQIWLALVWFLLTCVLNTFLPLWHNNFSGLSCTFVTPILESTVSPKALVSFVFYWRMVFRS